MTKDVLAPNTMYYKKFKPCNKRAMCAICLEIKRQTAFSKHAKHCVLFAEKTATPILTPRHWPFNMFVQEKD